MKVVIVGGVAGGASAAARIRRLDEHAQIIMIERSGYVSYANCGLPSFDAVRFLLCPSLRRIQLLSGRNTRAADSAQCLSLRNGEAMSENL